MTTINIGDKIEWYAVAARNWFVGTVTDIKVDAAGGSFYCISVDDNTKYFYETSENIRPYIDMTDLVSELEIL